MIKFFIKNNKSFQKSKKGFTLVELLITIVIFVILTGVVLFNQNSFDNTILLKNLAYDIALTVRQAQVYGVNVKESQLSGSFSSYGVYFNKMSSNKAFVLFADTLPNTPDGKFTSGDMSCLTNDVECVQRYSLKRNSYISGLCTGSNDNDCNSHPVDNLTLYFKRPDPDAYISSSRSGPGIVESYAKITVSSATNSASSSIIVTDSGQIYIKK
jgi:prepilin-type N-terminal cleavage/methylation domain-containing protein